MAPVLKRLHDGIHALHLVQRDTAVVSEVEVHAGCAGAWHLLSRRSRASAILLEDVVISGPCRPAGADGWSADCTDDLPGQRAATCGFPRWSRVRSDIQAQRVECRGMAAHPHRSAISLQGNTAHTADGVGKVLVDYLVAEMPMRLKNLGCPGRTGWWKCPSWRQS